MGMVCGRDGGPGVKDKNAIYKHQTNLWTEVRFIPVFPSKPVLL